MPRYQQAGQSSIPEEWKQYYQDQLNGPRWGDVRQHAYQGDAQLRYGGNAINHTAPQVGWDQKPREARPSSGFNVRSDREYISQYRDTVPRGQPYRSPPKTNHGQPQGGPREQGCGYSKPYRSSGQQGNPATGYYGYNGARFTEPNPVTHYGANRMRLLETLWVFGSARQPGNRILRVQRDEVH